MRHWSSRQIKLLWIAALLVQVAFLLPAVHAGWTESRHRATVQVPSAAVDSATRARLADVLRDSLGIDLAFRGDTIVSASLNARGDSVLRPALKSMEHSFSEAFDGLWLQVALAALAILSPVLVATVLTLTWWLSKRRARPPIAVSDG